MSNLSSEGELYGFIDANNDIIDYNALTNRPKINNKTVEGNHNGRYYGLTESEVIDWIDYQDLPEETKKNGKVYYIRNVGTYEEKTISNVAVASFNDGSPNPLVSLKIEIVPDQTGSGDPSPTNPRPISGWTGAEIHVADGETPHIVDNVVNVSWQTEAGTVYGGELDVTSGVLTVDRVEVDMGNISWYHNSINSVYKPISDMKVNSDIIGSELKTVPQSMSSDAMPSGTMRVPTDSNNVVVKLDGITVQNAQTMLSGIQLVYELTTPITIQLTPNQINSLLGINNIWSNTGNIIELKYLTPTGEIENQIRMNDEIFSRA